MYNWYFYILSIFAIFALPKINKNPAYIWFNFSAGAREFKVAQIPFSALNQSGYETFFELSKLKP